MSKAKPHSPDDGARTPFLKTHTGPGPFTPVDLAVQCGRPLLMRQPFARNAFDQVIGTSCLRTGMIKNHDILDGAIICGTGFAPFRGEPMNYAKTRGIEEIISAQEIDSDSSRTLVGGI